MHGDLTDGIMLVDARVQQVRSTGLKQAFQAATPAACRSNNPQILQYILYLQAATDVAAALCCDSPQACEIGIAAR